jgi:hypothetical protein
MKGTHPGDRKRCPTRTLQGTKFRPNASTLSKARNRRVYLECEKTIRDIKTTKYIIPSDAGISRYQSVPPVCEIMRYTSDCLPQGLY